MSKRLLLVAVVLMLAALALAACGEDKAEKTSTLTATATAPVVAEAALTYTTVDVQDAYARLEASDDALIVDVRNPEEWTATGVPVGAELISLAQFEQRAPSELRKDREILLICNSGNRSRVAAEALIRLGYSNVVNVDGGIQAWLRADLPVEPYTP